MDVRDSEFTCTLEPPLASLLESALLESARFESTVPEPALADEAVDMPRDALAPVLALAVTGLTWFARIADCRCAVCCWNDSECDALCVPKKCCGAPLWMVEAAAALPLADRLARAGTTGMLPVIMCALLNCAWLAAIAEVRPDPKSRAPTVESPRLTRASLMWATFEKPRPRSGPIPPKRPASPNRFNPTTPKRPPYPPHHG